FQSTTTLTRIDRYPDDTGLGQCKQDSDGFRAVVHHDRSPLSRRNSQIAAKGRSKCLSLLVKLPKCQRTLVESPEYTIRLAHGDITQCKDEAGVVQAEYHGNPVVLCS